MKLSGNKKTSYLNKANPKFLALPLNQLFLRRTFSGGVTPTRFLVSSVSYIQFIWPRFVHQPPHVCLNPILGHRGSKPLPLIAAAKKKSKRDDNHSFSTRLDEATGPFPESILLKEVILLLIYSLSCSFLVQY